MKKSKVYIVGAGPGDPGLITVKGMELIRRADAIVYDRLINLELLNSARKDAILIDVGKKPDFHPIPQEQINKILIELALENSIVVRLKGGDPFIFGRGSEECLALKENNIEFEVVPGITSSIAASAYSGIPLTHRNSVVQTIFITAHESKNKDVPQVHWENIAKMKNTSIVFYMGVSRLEFIVEEMFKYGRQKDEHVAIIENATLSKQRVILSTLGNIIGDAKIQNVVPPSLLIISPTVELYHELNWFLEEEKDLTEAISERTDSLVYKLEKIVCYDFSETMKN